MITGLILTFLKDIHNISLSCKFQSKVLFYREMAAFLHFSYVFFPYKKSLDFPGKSREKGWKFFQAFLGFHGFLKAEKKGKNPGKGWILFQAFSLRQEVFLRLLLCWESLENPRKARKVGKPWCLMTWDFPGKPGLPGKARFLIQILYSQFKKGRKRLEN